MTTLAVVFLIFALVFAAALVLLLVNSRSSPPGNSWIAKYTDTAPTTRVEANPPGFVQVQESELLSLRSRLEATLQQLTQQTTNYASELSAMRERQLHEMSDYRAKLELEFAEKKRAEARLTAERSRVALVAKVAEHMAPLLSGFKYNPKDARHLGELVDFLVYDGLEEGRIKEVVFLEVKTKRTGRLTNPREKLLRDAIEGGRVRYEIFIPDTGEAKPAVVRKSRAPRKEIEAKPVESSDIEVEE